MRNPRSTPDRNSETLRQTPAEGQWVTSPEHQNVPGEPVVTFIVPAFNEADNLLLLADRLLAVGGMLGCSHEILIVDDDSTDATADVGRRLVASHPEVQFLLKEAPRGLGSAVRSGIQHARGRLGIVVMADGVDPLESAVPRLVDEILRNGCHLVLLSRYMNRADADSLPWSYRTLHFLFRLITRYLLGIPYRDTTYAFRAFDLAFVRKLGLRSNGFEISPEITFKTVLAQGKVGEVPGRQTHRTHGKSKFGFLRVSGGYSRVVLETLCRRLPSVVPNSLR